ncbi:MAG: hypothetical protein JSS10_08820 [Verrucomicrobia bacterium]|nr:hypothetical protein [Verrucomicrobiota bacterium]
MALKIALNLGESLGLATPQTNVSMLDEKVQNFVYTEFPKTARELVANPQQYNISDVVTLLGQALVTQVVAFFFGDTKETAQELEMLQKKFTQAMFFLAYRNSNQKDKANDELVVRAYNSLFNSESKGFKKKEEFESGIDQVLAGQLNVMGMFVETEKASAKPFTPVFTIE